MTIDTITQLTQQIKSLSDNATKWQTLTLGIADGMDASATPIAAMVA